MRLLENAALVVGSVVRALRVFAIVHEGRRYAGMIVPENVAEQLELDFSDEVERCSADAEAC